MALRAVDRAEAHFRSDHAGCDDNLYVLFHMIGNTWKRRRTTTFDGYVGQVGKCPKCGRAYRGYVPKALMVEARLR